MKIVQDFGPMLFLVFLIFPACQPKLIEIPDPVYRLVKPTLEQRENVLLVLQQHDEFQELFKDKRYRILEFKPLIKDVKSDLPADTLFISCWKAAIYDYTDDINYTVQYFPESRNVSFKKTPVMGLPNDEEITLAHHALERKFGIDTTSNNRYSFSPAMPPVMRNDNGQRVLTFWVSSLQDDKKINGVYAVNVSPEIPVVENIDSLFEGVDFSQLTCGVPAQDGGSSTGGQLYVEVPDPFVIPGTLWKFTVVAPSSSSGEPGLAGNNPLPWHGGSCVELINVYYRGKLVLKRAHAPKLNVVYEEGTCGDSQNDYCGGQGIEAYDDGKQVEAGFQAIGNPLADGFMDCTEMPTTIVDNGTDEGGFKGVALYTNPADKSLLLVSEQHYGHYRYISEWTFYPNGVIEPRFKFDAVYNGCTCDRHVHHVYWRFDFDVNGADNSVIESYSSDQEDWVSIPPFQQEVTRFRTHPYMRWTINGAQNKRIDLIAGRHDGNATNNIWAKGDVFVARYHEWEFNEWSQEVGDGDYQTCFNEANLINGESLIEGDKDIVIWYRAESIHDEDVEDAAEHQIVGPTIKCHWAPKKLVAVQDWPDYD